MEIPEKETIRYMVSVMRKQSDYEKHQILLRAMARVPLGVDFKSIHFLTGDQHNIMLTIPLENIHSVRLERRYLYILCHNQTLHLLGLEVNMGHAIIPLEHPTFGEMFCWMCRSWLDRFRAWAKKRS